MLRDALGRNPRHQPARVVHSAPAVVAKGEGDRLQNVLRVRRPQWRRSAVVVNGDGSIRWRRSICHGPTVSATMEQSKDFVGQNQEQPLARRAARIVADRETPRGTPAGIASKKPVKARS
jgi:hypothetical protein